MSEPLSDRELDVLQLLVKGAANKEMAATLNLSPNTIKVHLRNIYSKLGVSSRTEALMVALEKGLVTTPGAVFPAAAVVEPDEEEEEEIVLVKPAEAPVLPSPPEVKVGLETPPAEVAPLIIRETLPHPTPWRFLFAGVGGTLVALLFLILVAYQLGYLPPATPTPAEPTAATLSSPPSLTELPETNWFSTAPLPQARAGMALVTVGLDVYQMGGEKAEGVSGEVLVYQTVNQSWRPAADKPTPVKYASAAVLLEIYVPGGIAADGRPTQVVEAYSPVNNSWRTVASLPKPLAGGVVLSNSSFVYHVGGWDGQQVVDAVYVYDPSSDAWRLVTPMPTGRAYAMGGFIAGKLYVVGGWDGTQNLDVCELYDPLADEWATCPALSVPRAYGGATVVLNRLYLFGGSEEAQFGEVFDPQKNVWEILNTPQLPAGTPSIGWLELSVTSVESRIYLLGGRGAEQKLSDQMFIYTPQVYRTFIPFADNQ